MHTFHIPVMATGFTIDTPLKVARFGIASVVSLVDDTLIEQVRGRLCVSHGEPYTEISADAPDARASRITAYLDLLHELVGRQVQRLRETAFEAGSEITRFFELLPATPLRALYERMLATSDTQERSELQSRLRAEIRPGPIDVNIMTKLDRDVDRRGRVFPEFGSDALSALRGFMNSAVDGSVVLSAGMNRRLFRYMADFAGMFPDERGRLRKRIALKVSDYRSALIQGKQLARLGLHVSEYRIESGLNCGGHAFGGKGQLIGPVLAEFQRQKEGMAETLRALREKAWSALGRIASATDPGPPRITAQGGIGEAHEDALLREEYGVDGTGWGSAFLFVPEVVNIDGDSLSRIRAAKEGDIDLSGSSPLGVPFWTLKDSASERRKRTLIRSGNPGSRCPKGFLASDDEFTDIPLCTASRAFQRRKLKQIEASDSTPQEKQLEKEHVVEKACICHDLAGGATGPMGIDVDAATSVCCGPNAAYFKEAATLDAMVDHIYGRRALPLDSERPHMLLKELSLNLEVLGKDIQRYRKHMSERLASTIAESRENLQRGVEHYRDLAARILAPHRVAFCEKLELLQRELTELGSSFRATTAES